MRNPHHLLVLCLLLAVLGLQGQQQRIDNLLIKIEGLEENEELVRNLVLLTDLYMQNGNLDLAEESVNKAMALSKKLSFIDGEARSLWKLADLALNRDVKKSKKLLLESLELSYQAEFQSTLVGTLNELGYYYLYYVSQQRDSARYYFEKSLEVNDGRYQSDSKYSYRFLSSFYTEAGDNYKALDYIERSIAIDTTNLYAWNSKAILLGKLGRNAEVIEVYLRIIREGEKINNPFVRTFQRNLADAYLEEGVHDKALFYAKAAYIKELDAGDLLSIHNSSRLLGRVFAQFEAYDSAMWYFSRSVELVETNSLECESGVYQDIAFLMLDKEMYDSALAYYRKALKINIDCEQVSSAAWSKLGIAKSLIGMQQYKLAELRLYEIPDMINLDEYPKIQQSLTNERYELYKAQGDYQKALASFEANRKLSDSLFSAENDAEIARLEANHEFEKEKDQLVAEQDAEKKELDNEIKRNRLLFYFAGIGLVLMGVFAYAIYRSHRKNVRAKKVIDQKNQELELYANQLRDSRDKLAEISQFKEGMTQMIAHDMKNPLNSIIGLSGQLNQKVGNDISKAGQALLRLVTNMLDVEKFEETKPNLELQKVRLSELVSEAKLAVELLLIDKSIKLNVDIEEDVLLRVDKELIVRVFVNLLSNAIKFSPVNATVSLSSEASEGGIVKIGVRDEGSGIPKSDQPYLFEKFYQRSAKKSGLTPSTGLGLTFCKMAIEAHNGTIEVESKKGEGATFWTMLEVDERSKKSFKVVPEELAAVSASEQEKLKAYSQKLKKLKVHNISAIMKILDEIEDLNLESKWSNLLKSAVQNSDKAQYEALINMI